MKFTSNRTVAFNVHDTPAGVASAEIMHTLGAEILNSDKTLYRTYVSYIYKRDADVDALIKQLLAVRPEYKLAVRDVRHSLIYSDNTYAEVVHKPTYRYAEDMLEDEDEDSQSPFIGMSLAISSFSQEEIADLVKTFKTSSVKDNSKYIHTIVNHGGNLDLEELGDPSCSLKKENYSRESQEGFDRIITDLKNPHPRGRLNIIQGPPGTGKTYMVRGIIDAASDDCIFVLIPSRVVVEVDGANILPILKQAHTKGKAVVLVIEDADECLVPREQGNMSLISSLLNLTDGIIGSLLDLRVIATTNAKFMDFEEALMRPGRLSTYIEVGALSAKEANQLYAKLRKSEAVEEVFNKETTLAQVYIKANGEIHFGGKKKESRMGF